MIWGRQDPHIPDTFMRGEAVRYDPEAARIEIGLALALFPRTL